MTWLDNNKLIIPVLAGLLVALVVYLFMTQLEPHSVRSPYMNGMMGYVPTSSGDNYVWYILISLLLGSVIAIMLFFLNKSTEIRQVPVKQKVNTKELRAKALDVIKKGLSKDELAVIREVEKTGSITQDSLRFRLNWSKAKVSTIVTNLDKLNLVQRERMGKTYRVFISKDFKK